MKYRNLGTSNLKVSVICLGTMTWGEQNTDKEAYEQMDYSVDQGINFFDTAEIYAVPPKKETYGLTEKYIGNWFAKRKNRDKIILATKIASKSQDIDWIRGGGKNLNFNLNNLTKAIDGSLKRLQTDYIDLYQLHWPERKVPKFGKLDFEYDPDDKNWTSFLEVLENLNKFIQEGKIRYVGVSNETPWGLMEFLKCSEDKQLPRMMSIQNVYSLVNRVFDVANSEVAINKNFGLLAYSPLAGGRLSGKYLDGARPSNARYTLWDRRFSRHATIRGDKAIKSYCDIAKKYGISPCKMALSYVNDRPFVTSNIIGATTMDQLKENIDSINLNLTNEIINEIEEVHSKDPNPCV